MKKSVLVIGGAGYIGSHCVRMLIASGYKPVVLDSLVYGHQQAIPSGVNFYLGDLGDKNLLAQIVEKEGIEIVMHFAAFAYVGESVTNPLKYYENNVEKTIRLLDAVVSAGVRKFIFSSTCATYGEPDSLPIDEKTNQKPINPYGCGKLMIESILRDLAKAKLLSTAVFRYFNAAGASQTEDIGESHDPETHLIPLTIDAATGRRGALNIFGTDYDTPDGTCIRDYVHVDDLSRAHISVIDKMSDEFGFLDYNLASGCPSSVKEVISAVERVSGLKVPFIESPKREGDPTALYADSSKARQELGWIPKYTNITDIIKSAWAWHSKFPEGYKDLE